MAHMIRYLYLFNAVLSLFTIAYLWGAGEGPLLPYVSALCGWLCAFMAEASK
jgi:cytochrome c biogenesis factor